MSAATVAMLFSVPVRNEETRKFTLLYKIIPEPVLGFYAELVD